MSDYLWDKTGEPDEEVVRLEEMLGGLGHKPRALELPPEAAPRTSFFGHARRFRPALFAAAAALLLMMLAGAAVMLRQDGGDNNRQSAETNPQVLPPKKESVVTTSEEPKPSFESPKREAQAVHSSTTVKGPTSPDFQASSEEKRRRPTASRGAGSNRQEPQLVTWEELLNHRQKPPGTVVHGPDSDRFGIDMHMVFHEPQVSYVTLSEGEAAKEKLVYAMRLASAKLGEVRKLTRGEDAPAQSFDERNRIR